MSDQVQVKREEVSVTTPSLLPDLSVYSSAEGESCSRVTLEDVVNSPGIIERIEQLDLLLLQISKSKHIEGRNLVEDAKFLRSLIRSDMTQIQVKVAELLDKYFKYGCQDESGHGTENSDALVKFYKTIHEDVCVYLLPNIKAAEFCTNFLCNLIATCSSQDVFLSIVKLFQKTVDGILGSTKNGKELPSESARIIIGIMKTLLSVTKAFGSPPAPLNLLCKISTSVIKSTSIHLCRLYSYNIIAFLLRDVTDDAVVASYTAGLGSSQVQHVTALIKESSSWNDVCNWKFKYQDVLTQSDAGSVNIEYIDEPPFTESDLEGSQSLFCSQMSVLSQDTHGQSSQTSRARKRPTPTANDTTSESSENWIKVLSSKFDKKRGNDGKPVVVDKNAWKGKLEVLEKAIKEIEKCSLHISSHPQLLSVMENIFKFESAIPVVINGLMLFTLVMRRSDPDIVSATKSQSLADLVFDKLKENNKKVRDAAVFAVEEIIMRCKPAIVLESFKRALSHKSPSCRETACNIINGKGVNIGTDERLMTKLSECSEGLKPLVAELANDKMIKVKSASALASKVLNDFELFSKNVPEPTKDILANTQEPVRGTKETTKRRINTVPLSGSKRRILRSSQQDAISPIRSQPSSQTDVFSSQPTTIHGRPNYTTQQTAFEQRTENLPNNATLMESILDKNVERIDKPINKIGIETLEKIAKGVADKGALLEGLCSLCMWINQHPEDAKEMDSLLLQFVSQHTNGYKVALGDGNVTLSLFFQHLIGLDLSVDGFSYLLDLLMSTVDLNPNFIFSAILCSHNQNVANRLFDHPKDVEISTQNVLGSLHMDRHVATLVLLKNHSLVNLIIGEPILAKILNYCAHFASKSVEPYKKLSLVVLSNLEKRTSPEHVSRLMDQKYHKALKNANNVPTISQALKLAHVEAGLELEKSISKDLYLCMFQEGNLENRKRSCLFWKAFVQKRNDRSESMLFGENNILGWLVIWLCHTLFEEKVDKVVLEILNSILGFAEDKGAVFAQNESFLLVESLCLYNGKYKRRVTDLVLKAIGRCTISVPLLECIFKAFEAGSIQEGFKETILDIVKSCKGNNVITCYILLKLESFMDDASQKLLSDVTNIINPLGMANDGQNGSLGDSTVEHDDGEGVAGREPTAKDVGEFVGATEDPPESTLEDTSSGPTEDVQSNVDPAVSTDNVEQPVESHVEATEDVPEDYPKETDEDEQPTEPSTESPPIESTGNVQDISMNNEMGDDSPSGAVPDEEYVETTEAGQTALAYNPLIYEACQFFNVEEVPEESSKISSTSVEPEISSLDIEPVESLQVPEASTKVVEDESPAVAHSIELISQQDDLVGTVLATERVTTEDEELEESRILTQEEIGSLDQSLQDSDEIHLPETLQDTHTLEECTPQTSGAPLECTITESIETCQRLSREIIRHSLPPMDVTLPGDALNGSYLEEHDPLEKTNVDPVESPDEKWNMLEIILSHCSAIKNSCLASSSRECLLPGIGEPKNVCTVHGLKIMDLLSTQDFITKTLAPVLVDMCHSGIVSLYKSIDRLFASENLSRSFSSIDEFENIDGLSEIIRAIIIILEIFQLVTSPTSLKNNLLLPFCEVIIHCLALPKLCFYNEELYGLLSRLISVNALQQAPETVYKCLLIMIELDIQTLERVDFGRTLLAKLRFTRILQMQMLLNLEHSRPTMRSHVNYNVLKQRHIVFVKKLEEFVAARPLYGINGKLDKVLQCSNVLLRTIE